MKPLFGGFFAMAMHRAMAHADVGRFSCLWGLHRVVKNEQSVKKRR